MLYRFDEILDLNSYNKRMIDICIIVLPLNQLSAPIYWQSIICGLWSCEEVHGAIPREQLIRYCEEMKEGLQ